MTGYTPRPPRKEISKVSLGAEESVPWGYHPQSWRLVERLKVQGVQIVALENRIIGQSTLDYRRFRPCFPAALLLGNEVTGLSAGLLHRADCIMELPMFGQKESLNVAVACGIALYELNRWRR